VWKQGWKQATKDLQLLLLKSKLETPHACTTKQVASGCDKKGNAPSDSAVVVCWRETGEQQGS